MTGILVENSESDPIWSFFIIKTQIFLIVVNAK